jgi:hypothetical protein
MIGFGKRLIYSVRCFFSIFFGGRIPEDIGRELVGEPQAPAPAPTAPPAARPARVEPPAESPIDRAVQMLALFQRDARLVDFLQEDIRPYADAQVGAAVRDVHENCQRVLNQYVPLEPIVPAEEGATITVPAGFDPASIKLIGRVSGSPPLQGVLRHRGWRVSRANLPPLSPSGDRTIVAPAEVEMT